MMPLTIHCKECGQDTSVVEQFIDTVNECVFYKLSCGHVVAIQASMALLTREECEVTYPEQWEALPKVSAMKEAE